MASETSSAVLDMTDECEETASGPVSLEASPLIMEHGYDIAVKVDAPLKQLSTLETFVTYRVRCVCARWSTPPYVRRRYNHFKVLHKRLCASHPLLPVAPLPPLHSARQQLDRYSPSFVAIRALALDAFLSRIAKHPIMTHSEDFKLFITMPDEELEKLFKSESGPLNLWGLGAALTGGHDAKNTNGVRVKDPEFSSAVDYLQSLQLKLTMLCSLTTKLYKNSTALGKEYTGMERACAAWAAAGAAGAAAGRAGAARAGAGRAAARARAALPLLAAYSAAVADKVRERDSLHAVHVAGTNTNDSIHNRLEQASEALRSELTDWNTKTRSEIKDILIELADKQVSIHQQSLMAWENALQQSTETVPEHIFKTVSKSCVQNLSPSKCRADDTPTATERDLEDFDMENDSDDSEKLVQPSQNISFSSEETNNRQTVDMKSVTPTNYMSKSVVSEVSSVENAGGASLSNDTGSRLESNDSEKLVQAGQNISFSSEETNNRQTVDVKSVTPINDVSKSVVSEVSPDTGFKLGSRSGVTDPLSEFADIALSKEDDM